MAVTPIGFRLRDARKKKRLTQTALAKTVGISVSYLNLIEHNNRTIGGALLNRLAQELELDISMLSGHEDARLIQQLSELATEPLLRDAALSEKGAQAIVSREPQWARGIINLHNAWRSSNEIIDALSDQLSRDPYMVETSHEILTHITSIRSFSEILDEHGDLAEPQRQRFTTLLARESEKLSATARELFSFLAEREQQSHPTTPAGEVDDFIIDNNNYFPTLEAAAADLHVRLEHGGIVDERALVDELKLRFNVDVSFSRLQPEHPPGAGEPQPFEYDAEAGMLRLDSSLAHTTLRFQIARVLFGLAYTDELRGLVDDRRLTTEFARERALQALARYGAGATLLSYDAFLNAAEELRYDIQMLTARFDASFEQVCHRLVTLKRPEARAVPFAFMRTDLAGNTSKRFSLPDLRLPRHGSACPLWAVYRAFLMPGHIIPQQIVLPDGRRFLLIARAIAKEAGAFGRPQQTYSIMLACNTVYANRLVYGDGLLGEAGTVATKAGINCRLCPRRNCPQRAYAQILRLVRTSEDVARRELPVRVWPEWI